ncbi:hypothetical protein EYF80_032307 [Liparis tanakae]|uniref:Uncharacterized protein n=1 Tax=Liparis tanakae TaxID=230148 RepID=A0A4Z2GXI1_9TELE|nr:hypothetical protein EYF80_032307 [Liparis tanakae]
MPSFASFASSGFSYVTKPKPRDLSVSLSLMTTQLSMAPYFSKAPFSDSSVVSKLSPPMNSFPSSDMMISDLTNGSPKESERIQQPFSRFYLQASYR